LESAEFLKDFSKLTADHSLSTNYYAFTHPFFAAGWQNFREIPSGVPQTLGDPWNGRKPTRIAWSATVNAEIFRRKRVLSREAKPWIFLAFQNVA
jgi:hypothetical protein